MKTELKDCNIFNLSNKLTALIELKETHNPKSNQDVNDILFKRIVGELVRRYDEAGKDEPQQEN